MKSESEHEQMNIVIVGHVDHGKSTVIGRLLADTRSLPEGKLEQVRRNCELNAKPFEYAFLLDALKDEQAQGITIDSARCFFKTAKRHYIIIDAPGHLEFLKNMISGAARAEAALLVIDAKEGVRENSRRHGFMLSMLGIDQVMILVNKMDLVNYRQDRFDQIKAEYQNFLKQIQVEPITFIPISARTGANLTTLSNDMPWYQGKHLLQLIDDLKKAKIKPEQPFRFPLQDIYKFSEGGDERRIFAGMVESGKIHVGDEVVFLPSFKKSEISSIEGFNEPVKSEVSAGCATGFTLKTQVYLKPGELMCRSNGEPLPNIGVTFRANLFWMGKSPMIPDKKYKMKIAANRVWVVLQQIVRVLDAADLSTEFQKVQIDRHDVAECILQTLKPVAFDLSREIEATGRFVIIDNYEIVGGGIITQSITAAESYNHKTLVPTDYSWEKSNIPIMARTARYHQHPKLVIITGKDGFYLKKLARSLEEILFKDGHYVYYAGLANLSTGKPDTAVWNNSNRCEREDDIRRIGEIARAIIGSGQLLITNVLELADVELGILKTLLEPNDILVIDTNRQKTGNYPGVINLMVSNEMGEALERIKTMLWENEIITGCYSSYSR
ncbi:MAG TPA: adenylyl-sulfate kinase [Firmicutes bacterium]|jgi:bifunctional enzyme CysN/CysC|nr:adenylyl-sulfate kinase [Bacillota bacterium]